MKDQIKNLKMNQIIALLFAVAGAMNFFGYVRSVIRYGFFNPLSTIIVVGGFAILAYTFYMERKDMLMVGGFAVLGLFELYNYFAGFGYGRYDVDSWY